jgi:hypothetical protein
MKALKDVLTQSDAVIFVGSGISQWSGLPSWWGVISQLADNLDYAGIDSMLVRTEARDGDLLQAASYGFSKLTSAQIGDFIRRVVQLGNARPVDIHQRIVTLGPTCFITTNYDDLLEQAIAKWVQGQSFRGPITNRQIVEQANIQHAQARRFIFKPHGDANDSESIVLSREQYRMLLPEGDYSATLSTLKTLLATRPVLFLGFGLRDPDFLYVRDILANLYRGGVRDHFAVIPDATSEHADYWRNSYGVHILGYKTRPTSSGGKDHGALLDLLNQIAEESVPPQAQVAGLDIADATTILSLARYAAGLATSMPAVTKYSIRVQDSAKYQKIGHYFLPDSPFDGWTVDRFLLEGPSRAVLTGAPGAGKTFAMVNAASSLANRLQDACIQNRLDGGIVVPVLVDLKLYKGQLLTDIAALFPPGLSLEGVSKILPIKLFLDAFNEMPREFLEKGTLVAEVQQLTIRFPELSIVVGSRTMDSLGNLEWTSYDLSEIPKQEVENTLHAAGLIVPELQRDDILAILQRPFYLRLLNSSAVVLRDVEKPADLYAQYIEHTRKAFVEKFGAGVNIVAVLEQQAYRMLEDGTEAFFFSRMFESREVQGTYSKPVDVEAIKNWLASRGIVVPLIGERGSFAHQSITEFLAARELVRRLDAHETSLHSVISFRRWDHAIFLALSLMDGERAGPFLNELLGYDVRLAISCARFIENRQGELLEMLLQALQAIPEDESRHGIEVLFAKLPFQEKHESSLRRLLDRGDDLAAAAMAALANLLGQSIKDELFTLAIDRDASCGYTPGNAVELLAPLIHVDDVSGLVARGLALNPKSIDRENSPESSYVDTLAQALQFVPSAVLRSEIFAKIGHSSASETKVLVQLLCRVGWHRHDAEMFFMLNDLIIKGHSCAVFPAYSLVEFYSGSEPLSLYQVDLVYLSKLIGFIRKGDNWATELMRTLCSRDASVAEKVFELARKSKGLLQGILNYCASGNDEQIFSALEEVAEMSSLGRGASILRAVSLNDLNWAGREKLYVTLLALKNSKVAKLILGGGVPVQVSGLSRIDLGDPAPWLEWVMELSGSEGWWTRFQVCFLLGRSAHGEYLDFLVQQLGDEHSPYRSVIAKYVLPHVPDLSTDQLPERAIEFLLTDLKREGAWRRFEPNLLSAISTEKFVTDHLLPMSQSQDAFAQSNARHVIEEAGLRLGRRFLVS